MDVVDVEKPKEKKQSDTGVFFGLPRKRKTTEKKSSDNDNSEPSQSKKKTTTRILQAATAEKWKTTSLAKYNATDWLVVNIDKSTNLVTSLNCLVCTKFLDKISCIKGFQMQWCEDGSKRLQHSAALEHAESTSHNKAYDLYMKDLGLSAHKRTERDQLLLSSSGQQAIVEGINITNDKDFELTKKKFESMYFLAKNKAPLSLFPKLLSHEERHGVVFGPAYRNRTFSSNLYQKASDIL